MSTSLRHTALPGRVALECLILMGNCPNTITAWFPGPDGLIHKHDHESTKHFASTDPAGAGREIHSDGQSQADLAAAICADSRTRAPVANGDRSDATAF